MLDLDLHEEVHNIYDTEESGSSDLFDDILGGNSTDLGAPEEMEKSSLLSVFIWCGILLICMAWCIYAAYEASTSQAAQSATTAKGEKPEKKSRAPWVEYFDRSGCQMRVQKEDILPAGTEADAGDIEAPVCSDDEEDEGTLVLTGKQSEKGERELVPNCCVICMDGYLEGETIVWSHSPECRHVFHQHCFIDYLLNYRGKGTPCPTCRRNFCSEGSSSKEANDDPETASPIEAIASADT